MSFALQNDIGGRPHPNEDLMDAPSLSYSVEDISPPMLPRSAHHHTRPRQIQTHDKINNMTDSRPQINSLDDYADLLLRKCDSLLRSYDREKAHHSPSKERKRRNNRKASHSSEILQSTSSSSSSTSSSLDSSLNSSLDSSSVLDSSDIYPNPRENPKPVEDSQQSNQIDSSKDAVMAEDTRLNKTQVSTGSEEVSSSSSDSSAFLYLSPASSVSFEEKNQPLMPPRVVVEGKAGSPPLEKTEETERTEVSNDALLSSSPSALAEDEVAPYLNDSLVSLLWKRLLKVREAIEEHQKK